MTTQKEMMSDAPGVSGGVLPAFSGRRVVGAAGSLILAVLFAGATTLYMPRGPVTVLHVWLVLLGSLFVGMAGGLAWRSRWALLVLPLAYVATVEVTRLGAAGPTVAFPRLDNPYGLLALLLGRGFHGLVAIPAMWLGVELALRRLRPAREGATAARALVGRIWKLLLAVGVAGLAVANAFPASTPPLLDSAGRPHPGSLAELTTVRLGGREQALLLRGRSADLPVLLYLSGGPGQSDLAYTRVLFEELTEDFIVVGWDQRGTGKSYAALDPTGGVTLDQLVADAIELSEYLRTRFDEEKIYLLGESWGSTLGVLAVQQRPDLYHAWIGSGQMVSQRETDRRLYYELLALAGRTGDTALRRQMMAYGPPPYADIPYPNAVVMANYPRLETPYTPPAAYIARGTAANLGPYGIFGSEYNFVEKVNVLRGLIDMFAVLYPQLQAIDFRHDVPELAVPVYLLDGAAELPARRDLALAWFDRLEAPSKHLYTFENAGHSVAFEQFAALHEILTETVLPAAQARTPGAWDDGDLAAFFERTLPAQLAAEQIAGAMATVVHDGQVVLAKGYGHADLAAGRPVTADRSLFFIGSDGKLFTWTAVMQLVEQGRLDLHADVNRYLDFRLPDAFGRPVTLHHLLTHTAGFEDEYNTLLAARAEQVLPLREQLLRFMPARVYPPGAVMAYSNYGTALAGYIVARVAGQPFETYLMEQLLQPLGMAHSFAGNAPPPALAGDLSQGYRYQDGVLIPSAFEWTAATPAAPIRTTAQDIGRFLLAHLGGGCVEGSCILRPETVADMHALHFTHHPGMDGMAYGFMRMRRNGQEVLWHLGGSARFVTMLALLPEEKLGLVVSYNTPPADDGRAILFEFMDEFYPVTREPLVATSQPGWEARATAFDGAYIPARSNHTTAQKLVGYLAAVPVQLHEGRAAFGGWEFVETEPGVFRQVGGDRLLTLREDEAGRRWLFVGVLAYFQAAWYETVPALLGGVAVYLLGFGGFLAVWCFRRGKGNVPGWGLLALAGGLGLLVLGLGGALALQLLGYAGSLVFPQAAVARIVLLFWLTVPWALSVAVVAVDGWLHLRWSVGWRLGYSVLAGLAVVMVWLLWCANLVGG